MGIELGRISGPLLAGNLLRNGADLAFETDLLYFDVNSGRIGVHSTSPTRELDVVGTTHFSNGADTRSDLFVTTSANFANLTLLTNRIQATSGDGKIYFSPNQATAPEIVANEIRTDNLKLSASAITSLVNNDDINFASNGSGQVVFNTTNVNVNGDLHATGDITWDGNIIIGDNNSDNISFTAEIQSNIVPNYDVTYDLGTASKRWKILYTTTVSTNALTSTTGVVNNVDLLLSQGQTIYVSVNGNDTYIGTHTSNTFRTIKKALSVAVAGDTVVVFPGTYQEIFPLTVPAGVTVNGANIRSVNITPTLGTASKDAFLLNGESTVENLTVRDFNYDSVNNTGYGFRFANNIKVTTRSPYVRNVSVITTTTNGPAGYGALVDGSVANSTSAQASMLFHSVTFIVPNADGITATNGARVEWLNSFTYFAYRGIYLTQGTVPSGSLNFSSSNYLSLSSAQTIGTQAYTFECFFYTASNGLQTLLGATASGGMSIWLLGNGVDPVTTIQIDRSYVDAAQYTVSAITINSWHHIAVTRDSLNNTSVFVDGVKATGSASNATNYTGTSGFIGAVAGSSYFFTGYLTQIKLAVGSNYYDPTAASISVPTAVLTTSTNTKLLLTAATSGAYLTDISGTQTVSNVGGVTYNTATPFLVKAGAEIRSINSANVYGTYGAVATGANTLGYLIGHNFGYIGSGLDSQNDNKLTVQANEIVEINGGRVYYDSMSHSGDYRVGDIFYVNQETGAVTFNAQSISFTAGGNITLNGPNGQTIIDARKVQTSNIRIYDNNIDSLSGPVNFSAYSGSTYLNTNVFVTGTVNVTGNSSVNGNVYLGDTIYDLITINPKLTQDLNPRITNTYNLGNKTTPEIWNTAFLTTVNVDGVTQITNNTISTLVSGTDLQLSAAGTGKIQITSTDVQLDQKLTVGGTVTINGATSLKNVEIGSSLSPKTVTLTGNIGQTGNTYITGLFDNNNISVTGTGSYLQASNVKILDNTISTTTGNLDLIFTANGTGGVVFDNKLKIVDDTISNIWSGASTDTQKSIVFAPNGTGSLVMNTTSYLTIPYANNTNKTLATNGEIRQNSLDGEYEGFNNTGNESLTKFHSADKRTFITPELALGTNDNIIRFYANNLLRATIDIDKLATPVMQVGNFVLSGNTINNPVTNSNTEFQPTGTGSINANGLLFKDDSITNTLNTPVVLASTGTGYVKFTGKGAVVFPFGNSSQRRLTPETGETRYNSELGYMEVYSGTQWIPATGLVGAASMAEIIDIMDLWGLVLG